MARDEALRTLLVRVGEGDDEAVREFLARYEREVLMMVRFRLPRAIRNQYESTDFVQAVWKSMLPQLRRTSIGFENERHLLHYLAGMVRNKIFEKHRRLTLTEKYDIAREEPLYVRRGERVEAREIVAPDPTPSQEAQAGECFEQLVHNRTPIEAEVIRLKRDGLSYAEIEARTRVGERSLRRIVDAAWLRLERKS